MDISPEERRKIYEEEKARIESEEQQQTADSSTTSLKPNVAGLLCYVGWWITGIIFLVLEQKNQLVRFHAAQAIIVFGVITIAQAVFSPIPIIGQFFRKLFTTRFFHFVT